MIVYVDEGNFPFLLWPYKEIVAAIWLVDRGHVTLVCLHSCRYVNKETRPRPLTELQLPNEIWIFKPQNWILLNEDFFKNLYKASAR